MAGGRLFQTRGPATANALFTVTSSCEGCPASCWRLTVNQDDRGRQDGSRRPDIQVLGCSSTCEPVSPTWKWHIVAPAANEVTGELFEVGPEICCSDVSSRCCRYGNYTAGSKPIWKLFIVVNGELNKVSVPKIITKCCELVKLCDINCSSPFF